MFFTKSLVFFSALVAAMCASSSSLVRAEEMTYGLKRQHVYDYGDVTTATTATAAASPDTAGISSERLAIMQRQKDKRGFSPYAVRAGVNSINNPTAAAAAAIATTTTAVPMPVVTTATVNTDSAATPSAPVANASSDSVAATAAIPEDATPAQ